MVEAPDCKPPRNPRQINEMEQKILHLFRQEDPDVGARVPGLAAIVAEHRLHAESGPFEPAPHLRDRTACGMSARSGAPCVRPAAALDVALVEGRQPARRVLPDRLDERQVAAAPRPAHAAGPCSRTRASSGRRGPDRCRTSRRGAARARRSRASRADRARGSATAGCRTARAPSRSARANGSERMSARTNGTRVRTTRAARADGAGEHRRRAIDADQARRRLRASGSEMRPVPQPSSSTGPVRPGGHAAPERRRRAARASARSPSRRTARTRPSLPSLASAVRIWSSGHRVIWSLIRRFDRTMTR